jgi:hypothetical protein
MGLNWSNGQIAPELDLADSLPVLKVRGQAVGFGLGERDAVA